jgi:hypothetical protein
MATYHIDNRQAGTQQAITTTAKSQVAVWSATSGLSRGRVTSIAISGEGSYNATDCQIVFQLFRQTVDGTGTSVTPAPLDSADTASRKVAKANYTIEGTTATSLWKRVLNQRASMQWTAPDLNAAIMWPATDANGVSLQALSPTTTATVFAGLEFEDL